MTAPEFRLIVAGSRKYDDRLSLRTVLNQVFDRLQPADAVLVVVCGCRENPDESEGADKIAQEWALEMEAQGMPVRLEAHPACWEAPCRSTCRHGPRLFRRGRLICPAAGPYRNEEMVAAGAQYGLGALKVGAGNDGTKGCLKLMLAAGIQFELVVQGKARGLPEDLISS